MSDLDRLLGDSLKGVRDEHIKQIEGEVPAARQRIEEGLRGRRTRFVLGGVALAAAALAAILFITQAIPRMDRSAPIRPSGEPVVIARIDVPGVVAMEAGFDRLWVSHEKGLVGIDPALGAIDEDMPVRNIDDMAVNGEAMYTIDSRVRALDRLGLPSNEAAFAIPLEATPTSVAASDDAVWVAGDVGPYGYSQIIKLSTELEPMDPGPEAGIGSDRTVTDMTYADGALWVSGDRPGAGLEVHRLDASTGSTWVLSDEVGRAAQIVVGEGAAWIVRHTTNEPTSTITRIDVETEQITERAVSFPEAIESIAVGEGHLWVTTVPGETNRPHPFGGEEDPPRPKEGARATLHRIDPVTLESSGEPFEVSGPGSELVVAYGYVWVGDPNNDQIVQIDPFGKTSPEPEPSTPDAEESEDRVYDQSCAELLPFEPGYRAGTWSVGVGSAGQIGIPLEEQAPQAVVHYLEEPGRFVDVIDTTTAEPPFPIEDEELIEVLDGPAMLSPIPDGFAITFGYGECSYQALAYGFERDETRRFAEGLVLRGEAGLQNDAFALWPESTPEEAHQGCLLAWDGSFRRDARDTATAFAVERLGWIRAVSVAGDVEDGDFTSVEVWRQGSPSFKVTMGVREVAADCWSVTSVRTVNEGVPDDASTGLSVSSIDGRTRVSFDLDREAAGRAVDSVRLIVGPGQVLLGADEFERNGFIELTDAPVDAPTYLLVLLFDEERSVVGAIGQALPSGDFSAG